jgi:PTH2 family peptidyl-tRNA hydrolase
VPSFLVQDAGRTVLLPGTITCLGLGPAPVELLDTLTGELKLL